jgi:hypothetical protein
MGIGDWDAPNPQSPIPNPQSPIPTNDNKNFIEFYSNIFDLIFKYLISSI